MQFKIGDFVRFVDEKREGYVTRIIDNLTLGVTDTDGFEIPVAVNNLTSVYGYESDKLTPAQQAFPEEVSGNNFIEDGLFLAVAAADKANAAVHFNLINRTSYQLLLSLKTNNKEKYKGEFAGLIPPGGNVQLYSSNLSDLEIWPDFDFQVLFFTVANRKPKPPMAFKRKFRAKDFSAAKEQIPEIKRYGWLIRLDEPIPIIDAAKLKASWFRGTGELPKLVKPNEEIDLHIEKLREDYQFLAPSELLNIQINHFQQMLDAAIVHRMARMVFIHGVGNGTLRHHIHKIISKHPQVRTFMDARKEKFGFGATEVIFKV